MDIGFFSQAQHLYRNTFSMGTAILYPFYTCLNPLSNPRDPVERNRLNSRKLYFLTFAFRSRHSCQAVIRKRSHCSSQLFTILHIYNHSLAEQSDYEITMSGNDMCFVLSKWLHYNTRDFYKVVVHVGLRSYFDQKHLELLKINISILFLNWNGNSKICGSNPSQGTCSLKCKLPKSYPKTAKMVALLFANFYFFLNYAWVLSKSKLVTF
jgi:hypothetical protein